MSVVLTSFRNSFVYKGQKFSIARTQPDGFSYTTLSFLSAVDKDGETIKVDGLDAAEFKRLFVEAYKARWDEIQDWFNSLANSEDIVLCCWCPHSKSSKKQVKDTGSFLCHSGLVGQMIQKHRPDIDLILDIEREQMLVKELRPMYSKCSMCQIEEERENCSWKDYCAGPYSVDEEKIRSIHY